MTKTTETTNAKRPYVKSGKYKRRGPRTKNPVRATGANIYKLTESFNLYKRLTSTERDLFHSLIKGLN